MDNDSVIRRKASNENALEWRLRQNEELYQLLVGPVTLKYIKLKNYNRQGI